MTQILDGVRVLDIGRYVAGPYCATLLGYFGADVIRVERRGGGEDRYIAPLFSGADGAPGEGGLFMQTGCSKRSIALDYSNAEGRAVLSRLAYAADVVVANLTPPALEKLGLDWPGFSKSNPRGILATQTSFGSAGPDRDKGGFDGVAQAMSGAMHLTGLPGQPVKAGAPYVDFSTAVFSALGVMAALMDREKSGRGQHVETSLLGTALAVMNSHLAEQAITRVNRPGTGNRVQTSAPSDVFATADGHILVHTVGDGLFRRWAKMIGRPELAEESRYQGDQARGDQRDDLCAIMAGWCRARTTKDALAALDAAGVPSGPVLTQQQALDNPQVAVMEFFKWVNFPGVPAPAPVADLPIRFSSLKAGARGRPPLLGEHTAAILHDFNFSEDEIANLLRIGVI